jgi:hypothetical protein
VTEALRVDYATLGRIQTSLALVARDFEGLHEQRGELEKVWGSRAVRNVMGDFADNWTTHRGRLREQIEELSKHCADTVRWFHEVDAIVAAGLGSAPLQSPQAPR